MSLASCVKLPATIVLVKLGVAETESIPPPVDVAELPLTVTLVNVRLAAST